MAIVKTKRYLNGKLFQLIDPKDKADICENNFKKSQSNWEKIFISVFVEGNSIIDKDEDIPEFTISSDFLFPS
jgi:hypothetical protein